MNFEKLLSFLQGASWALAIAGGGYTFLLFLPFGLLISAFIGLFFFLFGMVFVVVFEIAFLQIAKFKEMQKQTALLERCTPMSHDQTLSYH
jgi:uncharacterized membrane protein